MEKLKVKDVTFSYARVPVLKEVSLEVATKEILGVLGPNGAGKSTLLKCIDRILSPQKGCISLDGQDITKMSRIELAKKVGYIPQSISHVFSATVFDTVLIGRRPHLGWRTSEKDTETVLETLQMLHIEDLAMRDINELSGGQMQKVLNLAARYADRIIMMLNGTIFSDGEPAYVLTRENIKLVYGVDAEVNYNDGRPYIVPLKPVKQDGGG